MNIYYYIIVILCLKLLFLNQVIKDYNKVIVMQIPYITLPKSSNKLYY